MSKISMRVFLTAARADLRKVFQEKGEEGAKSLLAAVLLSYKDQEILSEWRSIDVRDGVISVEVFTVEPVFISARIDSLFPENAPAIEVMCS